MVGGGDKESSWRQRWDVGGGAAALRRKRLDQSHDVIRRPRGPYGGWTSYRRVGDGQGTYRARGREDAQGGEVPRGSP